METATPATATLPSRGGRLGLALVVISSIFTGCSTTSLSELEEGITVRVVSNQKTHRPDLPVQLKFFVDVVNESGRTIDVRNLKIELQLRPQEATEDDQVALRQTWTYRWDDNDPRKKPPRIADGKKLGLSIVPEPQEFPISQLKAGGYAVVARVNERHTSSAYAMRVERPDLQRGYRRPRQAPRRSTPPPSHRNVRWSNMPNVGRRR